MDAGMVKMHGDMAWWDMRVHAGMVIMHATMEKCILVW
jgi:hypothetical protein